MHVRLGQITLSAALGLGLLTAGCATSQTVPEKEAALASAGFEQRPANTPKRQAMLARLRPNKLLQQERKGHVVYVYSDPATCQCVYLGNEAAYARYKQNRRAEKEAVYANNDPDWDWQPWGMGGWRD